MAERCPDDVIYEGLQRMVTDSNGANPEYAACMMKNFRANNVSKLSNFDLHCSWLTQVWINPEESFYKKARSECRHHLPDAGNEVWTRIGLIFLLAFVAAGCIIFGVIKCFGRGF